MYSAVTLFSHLTGIFLAIVFAIVVGDVTGDYVLSLLIAVVILLAYHYWKMYRFNKWLWNNKLLTPPQVLGSWERLYQGVHQLQKKHRRKRQELSAVIRQFRMGVEALPDSVVLLDRHSHIIWCNRLARIELGIKWPEDYGLRIDSLIRNPSFVSYYNKGDFKYPIELTSPVNKDKKNEYRIISYSEDFQLIISRDVSHVSQLEGMRKDFVANVSHEMRTPLTVITGYIEMLPETKMGKDPFAVKALHEMSSQTKRMQNLIEDLLVLSKIESSSERIFDTVLDMQAMFLQIEKEAQRLNQDKNHHISFIIEKGLNVYGVESELRSACSNLVFNAIKYTPDKGRIQVVWYKENNQAVFKVIDNGDGIPARHLSRLTERFYRVDKARARSSGGSGLGLSIVKHVLYRHNSQLHIKSRIGQGSEFYFKLPSDLLEK